MAAEANSALGGLRAGDICAPNAMVLSPGDSLGAAIELMMKSTQHNFAVVHGSSVVGCVSRELALAAVRRYGPEAYVAGVMQRDLAEVDASSSLDDVRNKLMEAEGKPVVVRSATAYLGLLGLEDLGRVGSIATALRRGGLLPRGAQTRSGAELGS
jgi:predicted transcriptional regulator